MAGKTQITIKDIAKALNISASTVSRALKDNPDISQKTRDKVKAYAQAHHYQPNIMAMNLRMNQSKTIGVIVPQMVHYFFSCVLSGIEHAASKAGYTLLVAQSNELYEDELRITRSFAHARVCGVITSLAKGTKDYQHYHDLVAQNIPLVFYDRICPDIKTERVVVDDYAGSFAAVEYMIQTGCKHIYFFHSDPSLEITKNRRNGYLDAMKRYDIPVTEDMMIQCDTREAAIGLVPELLEASDRPDGFFAINDETATGILHVCKRMGLAVPKDVSICGFTDGALAQATDPKLTTVSQDGFEVGVSAFQLLMDKIDADVDDENHKASVKNKIVKTRLIVRGTTK